MNAPQLSQHQLLSATTWQSRVRFLMTIPHAVFLIALIILTLCTALSLRTEQSRQRESDRLAKTCAFVYLVSINYTNLGNLATSIQSLNKHFKSGFTYKIIIGHDDIPPVIRGRLQAVSEAPLDFRVVNLNSTIRISKLMANMAGRNNSNSSTGVPSSVAARQEELQQQKQTEKLQSQHMMRFWFYTACVNDPIRSSPFSDVDYIVRLSSDWYFKSAVPRDILRDFAESGAQYGFYDRTGKECSKNASLSLKQLATSYVELNGITPRSGDLWAQVVRSSPLSGPFCLPSFVSHLEVLNLRFFRSHSGIQDLLRVVDANGGIYIAGWKGSVLRFITVSLYAAREKIVKYDPKVIPYRRIPEVSSSN